MKNIMIGVDLANAVFQVHGALRTGEIRMLARKPRMLVAIALANKMARQIWAMLTKNEDFRDPAMAVVA